MRCRKRQRIYLLIFGFSFLFKTPAGIFCKEGFNWNFCYFIRKFPVIGANCGGTALNVRVKAAVDVIFGWDYFPVSSVEAKRTQVAFLSELKIALSKYPDIEKSQPRKLGGSRELFNERLFHHSVRFGVRSDGLS